MFKHPYGHNAIVVFIKIAIILQQNVNVQPFTALLRHFLLLFGNGNAFYRHAIMTRRIFRQPAPATTDIE